MSHPANRSRETDEKQERRVWDDSSEGFEGPTILQSLESQRIALERLEKSVEVLRERLSPVRQQSENKPLGMMEDDTTPGGYSDIHNIVRGHTHDIQVMTRRLEVLTHEVDI